MSDTCGVLYDATIPDSACTRPAGHDGLHFSDFEDGPTLEATMAAIARLWSDERCTVEFQYIPAWSGNNAEHTVVLEWTDDSDWLGEVVTYKTYRWQFNADTFAEAALDALGWCERLAPWKRCDECDGQGEWQGVACVHCGATGLAATSTTVGK